MKKFILIVSMLLFVISIQLTAQEIQPANKLTVADQTNQIIDKISDEITAAITQLGIALKVPAEHVYVVLIKQQKVVILEGLLIYFIALINTFLFITCIKKARWDVGSSTAFDSDDPKSKWYSGKLWNKYATYTCVFGTIGFVFIIKSATLTRGILTGIFNPEFGAMQTILNLF